MSQNHKVLFKCKNSLDDICFPIKEFVVIIEHFQKLSFLDKYRICTLLLGMQSQLTFCGGA